MGHSVGLEWNDFRLGRLSEILSGGHTSKEAAGILTQEWGVDVTKQMVDNIRARYDVLNYFVKESPNIKIYKSDTLPMDDYIISCDDHSPYFSVLYENRLLMIAEFFGIKKHIKVGDLVDQNYAKKWPRKEGEQDLGLDEEIAESEPLFKALDYFEEIYLVRGNHEDRINRMTDAKIQGRHILELFGKRIYDKIQYTPYDKAFIGDEWMVVHPKSYSQISGNTAIRLAEKYHRHVLNAHGHFVALRYDRSGEYMGIDLGGLFDTEKMAYINLQTTTHPAWNSGFAMLRKGKIWLFNESTDWGFWSRIIQ